MGIAKRWSGVVTVVALLAGIAPLRTAAQNGPSSTAKDPDLRQTRIPQSEVAPSKLVDPGQGGVGGTGLGKTTTGGDAPGTGMSVKGPAGQGIDGAGSGTVVP